MSTKIEWTEETWNPLRGCSKVSAGCANCYAERQAARFSGPGQPYEGAARDGKWTGKILLADDKLTEPLRWRKPSRVFVNSMSDLFHESVPDQWIDRIFAVMALAPRHTFQVLTKRPERMRDYCKSLGKHRSVDRVSIASSEFAADGIFSYVMSDSGWYIPNVWLGVSVEDQKAADERITLLLETPAAVRFVSCEPLLGPVDLRYLQPGDPPTEINAVAGTHGVIRPHGGTCDRLDWVIVGGESGAGARPCEVRWIRSIVDQCRSAGVPVFVKQIGSNAGWIEAEAPMLTYPGGVRRPAPEPPFGRRQPGWHRLPLKSSKGADPSEWPEDLRVREYPQPQGWTPRR